MPGFCLCVSAVCPEVSRPHSCLTSHTGHEIIRERLLWTVYSHFPKWRPRIHPLLMRAFLIAKFKAERFEPGLNLFALQQREFLST